MADVDKIRVDGVDYDIKDTTARNSISAISGIQADISGLETSISNLDSAKVPKTGNSTITGDLLIKGDLTMNGTKALHFYNENNTINATGAATLQMMVSKTTDGTTSSRKFRFAATSNLLKFEICSKKGNADEVVESYYVDYCRFTTFTGTKLTAKSKHEYNNNTVISKLTIKWPSNGRGVIFGVNFTSGTTAFVLKHQSADGSDVTNSVKTIGSATNLKNKRYNLICWYDGLKRWCAVKAA